MIGTRDFDGLAHVFHALEDADDEAAFALNALNAIRGLIDYDAAGYNDFELAIPGAGDSGTARWVGTPAALAAAADRQAFELNMHQHPALDAFIRTRDEGALTLSDFVTAKRFHARELYQDFYRPLAIEHQLIVQWQPDQGRVLSISLFRSRRDFSERDRQLLGLLRPYFALGQRSLRARLQTQAFVSALEHTSDHRSHAVVLMRRSGAIELHAGASERWLASFFGHEYTNELPDDLQRWVSDQRRRFEDGQLEPPAADTLYKEGDAGRLEVRFVRATTPGQPDALLLSLNTRATFSDDRLRALGLSAREAQVLELVARGATDATIGAELSIQTDTVKKHLQRIYHKLDVHSRSAAVAEALAREPA